jgi:hypothetical protein
LLSGEADVSAIRAGPTEDGRVWVGGGGTIVTAGILMGSDTAVILRLRPRLDWVDTSKDLDSVDISLFIHKRK